MAMTTRKKADILSKIYDNQMNRQERMIRDGKFKGAGGIEKYSKEVAKAAKVNSKWAQEEAKHKKAVQNTRASLVDLGLTRKSSKYN